MMVRRDPSAQQIREHRADARRTTTELRAMRRGTMTADQVLAARMVTRSLPVAAQRQAGARAELTLAAWPPYGSAARRYPAPGSSHATWELDSALTYEAEAGS